MNSASQRQDHNHHTKKTLIVSDNNATNRKENEPNGTYCKTLKNLELILADDEKTIASIESLKQELC